MKFRNRTSAVFTNLVDEKLRFTVMNVQTSASLNTPYAVARAELAGVFKQ